MLFCRVTQIGLLRLLTSEIVMREDVLSTRKAWNVYQSVLEDNRIQFAPEPFLTAFARVTGMRLVTMDRAVARMQAKLCCWRDWVSPPIASAPMQPPGDAR
jgi:hypothetical protein